MNTNAMQEICKRSTDCQTCPLHAVYPLFYDGETNDFVSCLLIAHLKHEKIFAEDITEVI